MALCNKPTICEVLMKKGGAIKDHRRKFIMIENVCIKTSLIISIKQHINSKTNNFLLILS